MKRRASFVVMTFGVLFPACGGGDPPVGPPLDASSRCGQEAAAARVIACSPQLPECWTPTWRPPKTPVSVCTEAQITAEVTKCFGDTFDPDCDVFERDPANAACLGCIFSTYDEPKYGAVIFFSNGSWVSNIPGCLALVDGDASSSGCGAKAQAYAECSDVACAGACSTFEEYDKCWLESRSTVCTPLRESAVCRRKPSYAICNSYDSNIEYFIAMAKIFCVSGLDGGTTIDAGSLDDAAD